MIKILTVIGARPQIIKAAAINRAIKNKFTDKIREVIVHTGQHYDNNMSEVFFEELGIPMPDYNLNVGSDIHGIQTAKMITGIEEILIKEKPDFIIIYGDTNSTLSASIAASKIHIPIIHIEAGMRSFNKTMPEEINRIVCDHCSTMLFSPTKTGFNNLVKEGFKANATKPYTINNPKIYHCGDIMYDNSLYFAGIAEKKSDIIKKFELEENGFVLCTIHRDNNTDNSKRLNSIFKSLNSISAKHNIKILIPLHPRTSKLLKNNLETEVYNNIINNRLIKITEPVSFLEMILLEKNSRLIVTDSGGVQKEAYYFKKPSIILRPETEWVEIIQNKAGILADCNEETICNAFEHYINSKNLSFPPVFGDGHASEFICEEIIKNGEWKMEN